jgi:hypothetical protein
LHILGLAAVAQGKWCAVDDKKSALRKGTLRWHPDKFIQAFGNRLHPKDRDAILAAVKNTAQRINALKADLLS